MPPDKTLQEEIARRKAIWQRLQVAAKAALKGVLPEARRRGVRGTNWVSYYTTDYILVPCNLRPQSTSKSPLVRLKGTGEITPDQPDTAYDGYLDVADTAAGVFIRTTAEILLLHLDEYC